MSDSVEGAGNCSDLMQETAVTEPEMVALEFKPWVKVDSRLVEAVTELERLGASVIVARMSEPGDPIDG